jgi:serine/threonine protein kinase
MIKSISYSVIIEPDDSNINLDNLNDNVNLDNLNDNNLFHKLENHGILNSYIDKNIRHVKFMNFNTLVYYGKNKKKSIQQQLIYKTNKKINFGLSGNIYFGKYKLLFHTDKYNINEKLNKIYEDNYKIIEVAIKIIKHNDACNNTNNEVDFLSELVDIPDVIHLFNYSINPVNKTCVLVLELCEGGDLFDYFIKNYKLFDEKNIKYIIKWLINIIKICHSRNIFHSDIKLENIGLRYKDDLKNLRLLDFGGSKFIDDNIEYDGFISTSIYISPEILKNVYNYKVKNFPKDYKMKGTNLFKIDIWAIGIVLYILSTGKVPYKGKNMNDTFNIIAKGNPPDMNLIKDNKKLSNLILKFLDYNPNNRITLDDALNHPFLIS